MAVQLIVDLSTGLPFLPRGRRRGVARFVRRVAGRVRLCTTSGVDPSEAVTSSTKRVPTCSAYGRSPSGCQRPVMGSRPLSTLERGCRPPSRSPSPGTNVGDILTAARYLAETLIGLQHLLSSNERYELPDHFGAFVAADLARADGSWPLGPITLCLHIDHSLEHDGAHTAAPRLPRRDVIPAQELEIESWGCHRSCAERPQARAQQYEDLVNLYLSAVSEPHRPGPAGLGGHERAAGCPRSAG